MATINRLKTQFNIFFSEKFARLKKKIFSFLRYQKPIAGLAIVQNGIYAVIFDESKGGMFGEKTEIESFDEESIKNGLKKLKEKFGRSLSSVVISLPPAISYISVFEFPMAAEDQQIEEAMKLAFSALPFPESDIYSDWMFLENFNIKKKETVLETTRKHIIDYFLKIFEQNKIGVIAAENYIWSIGQFLKNGDDTTMVIIEQPEAVIFAIYDGRLPYFRFNLPRDRFKNEKDFLAASAHYLKSLAHFVLTDDNKMREINSIIAVSGDELADYLQKNVPGEIIIQKGFSLGSELENVNDLGFLSALGAVKRGLIPRKKDNIISLLPIGTELAYERHRLFSFVDFFQKFSIGFAGFLIVVFLGALIMVKTFFSGIEESLKKEVSLPADVVEIRDKAVVFNKNVVQLLKIKNQAVVWEKIFIEIDKLISETNIIISQLGIGENGDIAFSGIAPNRDNLVKLKDYLAASPVFSSEPLPLSLFLNRENIAFSIKTRLKDLKILYSNEL